MRIGMLRDEIEIQQRVSEDDAGWNDSGWNGIDKVLGHVNYKPGRQIIRDGIITILQEAVVTLRYRPDVQPETHRLVHKDLDRDHFLRIETLEDPDKRRRWLVAHCSDFGKEEHLG